MDPPNNTKGCNIQDFKPSDADTNIAEDPTGISGLRPESDRTLSALNSDVKGLERNKKSREAYRMKKDVSQGDAIISSGGCFDWTHICTIIYACLYLNMFSDIAAVDDHVECISSTAPTIDHPPTGMLRKHLSLLCHLTFSFATDLFQFRVSQTICLITLCAVQVRSMEYEYDRDGYYLAMNDCVHT